MHGDRETAAAHRSHREAATARPSRTPQPAHGSEWQTQVPLTIKEGQQHHAKSEGPRPEVEWCLPAASTYTHTPGNPPTASLMMGVFAVQQPGEVKVLTAPCHRQVAGDDAVYNPTPPS
jgi:hypothetical protein